MIDQWKQQLLQVSRPEKIPVLQRFFKTAPGEYGFGDRFIGVYVPDNRRIARRYHSAPDETVAAMLESDIHEHRLSALLSLVERYRKSTSDDQRQRVVDFYLKHCRRANNWDLVDLSAPYILGEEWVAGRNLHLIDRLQQSDCLWLRRIAVVGMLPLIRSGRLDIPFETCHNSLTHTHQLMQKAVGWMLREAGKKDEPRMKLFLEAHIHHISAITLSYAVERLPKDERTRLRALRRISPTPHLQS